GRLGIVTGHGLSQAIRRTISQKIVRFLFLGLVLVTILLGNAAYQTGNIIGAVSGVMALAEPPNNGVAGNDPVEVSQYWVSQPVVVILIGIIVIGLIGYGKFSMLQGMLTCLVVVLSFLFLIAAIFSSPQWSEVFNGFVPRIPNGSEWVVIGLIGTTVVPYNLFLHAGATAENWEQHGSDSSHVKSAIQFSRWDTVLSVLIGGVVTACILVTASVAFHQTENDVALKIPKDVAVQLQPVLGVSAKWLFAIGLLSAGLTSAITAPIASAYAASGCFGWSGKLSDWRLKAVSISVVLTGCYFALAFGGSPSETILIAQIANGLLLPIIVVFLILVVNQKSMLGNHVNGPVANLLAIFVLTIVSAIAIKNFGSIGTKLKKMFESKSNAALRLNINKTENWNRLPAEVDAFALRIPNTQTARSNIS
ncbi:MAG: divalent metal cation transporter, partial [Planctomycetota bacterium]